MTYNYILIQRGEVYGLIGRFSGELVLNFKRYEDNKSNSLIFSCRKFKFKIDVFNLQKSLTRL